MHNRMTRRQVLLGQQSPRLFERLRKEYAVWNAAMLPYPAGSFSENPKGLSANRY